MSLQLALRFGLPPTTTFAQFFPGKNRQLVDQLTNPAAFHENPFCFLWGNAGTGKTHLLQALCHHTELQGRAAAYVPLREISSHECEMLEVLADLDMVCIDDLQVVLGKPEWEEAIFALFNQRYDRQKPLVLAADAGPRALPFYLPDLRSRMEWGLVSVLQELEEIEKLQVMQARALFRGMELPKETAQYILHHFSRNLTDLCELVDKLDQASLMAQRKLTIPFIKEVLRSESR